MNTLTVIFALSSYVLLIALLIMHDTHSTKLFEAETRAEMLEADNKELMMDVIKAQADVNRAKMAAEFFRDREQPDNVIGFEASVRG